MKKTAAIAAAIAVAAIAGWSGLWFTGRGAVADRLDREVTQLQALGFGVTYDAREIGGSTALEIAAGRGHGDIVRLLRRHAASTRQPDASLPRARGG